MHKGNKLLLKLKSEIRFLFDFRVTCRCLHLLSDTLLFWLNTVLAHDVWTFLPIGSSVSLCLSSTEYIFYPSHQAVILVLGAKVIPGFYEDASSSFLFSEEISTPQSFRVVFLPKNLASSNPDLFRAPETKTTDAKRKRIKNVG